MNNGREWGTNVCMHKRGMSGASGTVARHVRTGRLYEKMSNCIKFQSIPINDAAHHFSKNLQGFSVIFNTFFCFMSNQLRAFYYYNLMSHNHDNCIRMLEFDVVCDTGSLIGKGLAAPDYV